MASPPPPMQPVRPVNRNRARIPARIANRPRGHFLLRNPIRPRPAIRAPATGQARRAEARVAVHGGKKLIVPPTEPPAGMVTVGSGTEHCGITTKGRRLGLGPVHFTITWPVNPCTEVSVY